MPHPYADVPLVVLSGVGRSGTFATREAMGRHPLLHSTERENHIVGDLLDVAWRNCTLEPRVYAMRVDRPTYDRLFRDMILDLLWPQPRHPRPRAILAFTRLRPDIAGYLVTLFRDVRIVYLVRNGVEVVSSRLRYESFADQPFHRHCELWAKSVEMPRWGRDRDDFLPVRHERLIDAATAAMDEVWSFVGLPPEPAAGRFLAERCLHPTRAGDERRRPAEALADRGERWRDWSARERDLFAEICGPAMQEFGYPIPWQVAQPVAS